MKTIMVAIDFSDATPRVIEMARTLAKGFGSTLHLVHVFPLSNVAAGLTVGAESGVLPVVEGVTEVKDVEKRLAELKQGIAGDGVEVVTKHLRGTVTETLISEAGNAHVDLIVVGSHGHGAVYHLVVGSVTEGLLRKSTCPIVVVPTRGS